MIHYNAKTKQNTVLLDKVHFANGIVLSADEDFLVIAETGMNRLLRYYLKGPKKGTSDILIDGLPGHPDNLKSFGKNGILVPLVMSVDDDHPQLFQVLYEFPLLRKLISRVFGLIELAFDGVNKVYPNEFSERSIHFVSQQNRIFYVLNGIISPLDWPLHFVESIFRTKTSNDPPRLREGRNTRQYPFNDWQYKQYF